MMNEEIRDCYRHLELRPGAPPEEIKKAFHDLVKVWHPDRFAHDPVLQQKAQEKLKEINLAYDKLKALADQEELPHGVEPDESSRQPARRPSFRALGDRDPLTTRFILVVAGSAVFAILLIAAFLVRMANPPDAAPEPPLVKRYQGKGFGLVPKHDGDQTPASPLEKDQQEAANGNAPAQFALGKRYEKGDGVLMDKRQAVHWYAVAATNGLAAAQTRLGEYYLQGKVLDEDIAAAARWFQKGAQQNDPDAQCHLGSLYAEGRGVPQNFTTAMELYQKAAEQGHARAQYELGLLESSGKQIPANVPDALKWYRLAAGQGFPDAQYRLGDLYRKGEGVEADKVEAYKWYNLAAAGDAPYAEQARDQLVKNMTREEILEAQKRSAEFKPVTAPHRPEGEK